MKPDVHAALLVLVMAAVTAALRFLPFLLFKNPEKQPKWVSYLGRVLPPAIIGMLVVYCLRTVSLTAGAHGLPELISCAVTAGLQFWKINAILSIVAGTAVYMVLIQAVFV